ncbi:hypothetical protein D3C84_922240 [compost metagenome]
MTQQDQRSAADAAGRLAVIYDLLTLSMRKYVRRVEGKTLVQRLVELQGSPREYGAQFFGGGVYRIEEGICDITSVPKKITALAIVAKIMRFENSDEWWLQAVKACREVGFLLPETAKGIYADLVWSEVLALDRWFRSRLSVNVSTELVGFLNFTMLD